MKKDSSKKVGVQEGGELGEPSGQPYPGLRKRLQTAGFLIVLSLTLLGGSAFGGVYAWGIILCTYLFLLVIALELVSACAYAPSESLLKRESRLDEHSLQGIASSSEGLLSVSPSLVSRAAFFCSLVFVPTLCLVFRLDSEYFFSEQRQHFLLPHILLGSGVSLFSAILPVIFQTSTDIRAVERIVLERIVSVFFVGISGGGLVVLAASSEASTLFLWFVAVIAMNDSGAYFVGARFRSPALSPVISPKKTLLGSVGGLVAGLITGLLLAFLLPFRFSEWDIVSYGFFAFIVVLLLCIAQLGDLLKSMLKRSHGMKDMGTLLPGHGGMLDRFDGILASCLAFLSLILIFRNV